MKKFFILLVLVVFAASINVDAATNTQAQKECLNILTNDHQDDGQSFRINLDSLGDMRNYGHDHLAKRIRVIREHLKNLGCKKNAVNFGWGSNGRSHNKCKKFDYNKAISRMCWIETNLGSFFVHEDNNDHMNIIFTRFD
ncbi:MAG: hypothetical protein HN576_16370 [Bacteriovoracaceae bacterium]|jgi:hypothetical protein|nr:hypothetical protein [Bacteriovoracaceae bacterium]